VLEATPDFCKANHGCYEATSFDHRPCLLSAYFIFGEHFHRFTDLTSFIGIKHRFMDNIEWSSFTVIHLFTIFCDESYDASSKR